MGSYDTQFKVLTTGKNITELACDVLILPVYQAEENDEPAEGKSKAKSSQKETSKCLWTEYHHAVDNALGESLLATLKEEKFSAALGKRRVIPVRPSDEIKTRWVVVLGLGPADKLTIRKVTDAFQNAMKDTFGFKEVAHIALALPSKASKISASQLAQAAGFAGIKATYKTQEAGTDKVHKLKTISLLPAKGQKIDPDIVEAARVTALAESFTKDLANMPANLKTAEKIAQAARELGSIPGVTVTVLSDAKKIQKEMPAFWAVAQGAAHVDPPRFIQVHYKPSGKSKPKKKIALIGKGVIFDTGGVQVKTGNYMNDMKFDMTGAASVLGAVKAAAELKLKNIEVTAYVAATKNLTGEEAYLPDSIIDSASGKKIEIRHTDAEGRLTLADAVYKASLDNPDEMLTIATLTGSAGAAVGMAIALMGTDDDLVNRIEGACKSVGEYVQKLDFFEEDFDNVKSDRDAADFLNTSKGKNRGHMTAGAFVVSFANGKPIAHLDIAGGDAKDGNATGIAVKGLIAYLQDLAD